MIVGSAPFVVTIPITVLAGALQLKTAESPAMAAAAGTMLLVASVFQVLCLVSALVMIEEVASEHKDELMAEPMDEVRQITETAATLVCLFMLTFVSVAGSTATRRSCGNCS